MKKMCLIGGLIFVILILLKRFNTVYAFSERNTLSEKRSEG